MPAIESKSLQTLDGDLLVENGPLGDSNFAAMNVFRTNLATFVDLAKKDNAKLLITEHNKPAAAVVPVREFRILKLLDRMGVTEKISELTYSKISPDEALSKLEGILRSAISDAAGGSNVNSEKSDGEGNSTTPKRRRRST